MRENHSWSRRKFSKAIVSAQLLLASGALVNSFSCSSEKNKNVDSTDDKTLIKVMNLIIPSSGKMPSASKAGVLEYIKAIHMELPELRPLFLNFSSELNNLSLNNHNLNFIDLNNSKALTTLQKFEREFDKLFKVFKDFIYEAYYTNPEVWKLIGYTSFTTGSAGPEMEPFDEKLLARVKNSPPSFIRI